MNLAVDPKNFCVKFVRWVANAGTLDPGMPGIEQVTVDMIAQLAGQWKVCSRGRNRRVLRVGGVAVRCSSLLSS